MSLSIDEQDTAGLEKILKKKRLFLIDTNVMFSSPSGFSHIEDETIQLAAALESKNQQVNRAYAVYNLLKQYQNVRFTPEVYQEVLAKFGNIIKSKRAAKKSEQSQAVSEMDNYLRRNKNNLLISSKLWVNSEMVESGYMLENSFGEKQPKLKPLSKADLSLLLQSLEFLLKEDYQRLDVIACDYGILKGMEIMMDMLNEFPVGSDKAKRRVRHRTTKLIFRKYDEQYHTEFDSLEYLHRASLK